MLLATQIILCITLLGNVILLALLLREKLTLLRSVFALYVAGITGWAVAIFLNLWFESLVVEQWVFACAAIFLTAQFWFAKLFPDGELPQNPFAYWSLALGAGFTAASFFEGALFTSITVHPEGYTTLQNGFLSGAYSLFALAFVFAPIFVLSRKYRIAQGAALRQQLGYLILGFSLFAAVNVLTNSALPVFLGIYFFNAIGPVFSLFLAAAVFYIINRHQFLDIRIAVQRGLIYSTLFALIVAAYFVLLLSVQQIFSIALPLAAPLSAGVVMLVGIASVPVIERFFRRVTDQIFFKDKYDYAEALRGLTERLHKSVEVKDVVQSCQEQLGALFKARVRILPKGAETPEHALAVPISSEESLLGHIYLQEKRSGDPYTAEDVHLLETFAYEAAITISKALLFEKVKHHAKELEEKVRERTQELKEAHEGQRQMMLDIAHGLQTPLTVLRSKLERPKHTLLRDGEGDSLRQSVDSLSVFIYEMLSLAALEQEAPGEDAETFSLSELVAEVAEEIEVICTERGIKVRQAVEPGLVLYGDRKRLREALLNIASNAIAYCDPRKEKREITFSLQSDGASAVCKVADNGIGISQKDLPRIFERFYRGEQIYGSAKGNGLGLAIAKGVVERYGGSIAAASTQGEDSVFTLTLPLNARL